MWPDEFSHCIVKFVSRSWGKEYITEHDRVMSFPTSYSDWLGLRIIAGITVLGTVIMIYITFCIRLTYFEQKH